METKHTYSAKHICRFYGKIIGNQLPVTFRYFCRRPYFQEPGTVRKQRICIVFSHIAFNPTKVFSGHVG